MNIFITYTEYNLMFLTNNVPKTNENPFFFFFFFFFFINNNLIKRKKKKINLN